MQKPKYKHVDRDLFGDAWKQSSVNANHSELVACFGAPTLEIGSNKEWALEFSDDTLAIIYGDENVCTWTIAGFNLLAAAKVFEALVYHRRI